MFYSGDDGGAKAMVHRLVEAVGFAARDAGPLRIARYMEPFAVLWINQAMMQREGRDFEFVPHKRWYSAARMASRRTFFFAASAAAAASQSRVLANGKVRLAVLGVNGRGKDHIAGFGNVPAAQSVRLCDPDLAVAPERAAAFEKRFRPSLSVVPAPPNV